MSSSAAVLFPPDLDALRLKLVSLIDALTSLQSHLQFLAASTPQPTTRLPGILPYADLLNRYNLLLSHIVSLGTVLSSVNDGREVRRGDEGKDRKRDAWDSAVVVPAEQLEEAKDWIVGVLLRTKQTPAVEAHLAAVSAALPPAFTDPTTQAASIDAYAQGTARAYERIAALKDGLEDDEWDWKGRVEVDEDDDDQSIDGDPNHDVSMRGDD